AVLCQGGRLPRENMDRLRARVEGLVGRAREQLAAGAAASDEDRAHYQKGCLFLLYENYGDRLQLLVKGKNDRASFYEDFVHDCERCLPFPGAKALPGDTSGPPADPPAPAHLLATFFHRRRAFEHIFSSLVGMSRPMVRLRASVWQSIFTDNLPRF